MTFQLGIDEGLNRRRQLLNGARRLVVKVGSAVLTTSQGLNLPVMEELARDLTALRQSGLEIILVSSGAVAAGRKALGLGNRPLNMKEKQAAAAFGQSALMRVYEDIFEARQQKVAQVLLTHNDLANRDRYLNIRNTLFTMFDWQLLPIINENDTVSVKELRFGDNDTLAAMTTNLIGADAMICLTDVDGLYSGDPALDPEARLVHTVARVDQEVEDMAGHVHSALGTGGMRSKIMAARMVAARGGSSLICCGREAGIMRRLFSGEPVGTFFLPQDEIMHSRQHWIAYTLRPKGFLVLDEGACQAIMAGGKSLLPSGIIEIRGDFGIGDPVHCLDSNGEPLAAGLVNYAARHIKKIQGRQSKEIKEILGFVDSEEIIHRDNLVLL
ncbi:Glutamate 5-kinase / RNA-binding C-terminal domain PUA [hydrothermal vent metagenome]|uniref:Glutamate 5-kinase / RNA-binding C-terminal domain PUA n=1 Tax=hydrothermal vent metagenome TaxID=652676 RepID=A0A3B0VXS4_9ZZZZ